MEGDEYRALRWNVSRGYPICFVCGEADIVDSHVVRTGEIKDLVVIEESGIAKGIRRITAVTGHEAAEARRLADAFTARLNQLDSMSGPEKDAGLKSYTVVRAMRCIRMGHHADYQSRSSARLISLFSEKPSSGIVSRAFGKPLTRR